METTKPKLIHGGEPSGGERQTADAAYAAAILNAFDEDLRCVRERLAQGAGPDEYRRLQEIRAALDAAKAVLLAFHRARAAGTVTTPQEKTR